jgi:ribonucleotide reductase beta subunit family protein with ferritin-like domain
MAAIEDAQLQALEERPTPYDALYAHWERHQWSSLDIDLETDAATFHALGDAEREGFLWMFSHRFHAEFHVARLLAPFLLRAPDYDMQLLLATQVADEHRHLQLVLRVYREVFGVHGGIETVKAAADRYLDVVAIALYERLDHWVSRLNARGADEDDFLRAVVAYHLLAEGVIARTAQNLTATTYERLGAFGGLAAGQRLVARDEARHIGIGVSYVRRRLEREPQRSRAAVADVVSDLVELSAELLDAASDTMSDLVRSGYGVAPQAFYTEAMRLTQLRLRSIGLD